MAAATVSERQRQPVEGADPLAVRRYTAGVCVLFVAALAPFFSAEVLRTEILTVGAFVVAAIASDVLRVRLWPELNFSMSQPVVLASAFLVDPWIAGLIGFLGSADTEEVRRRIPLLRLLFNRCQIGLSVLSAAAVLSLFPAHTMTWPLILGPSLAALITDACVNAALVSYVVSRLQGRSIRKVLGRMLGSRDAQSIARYISVGLMAPLIATSYESAGVWGLLAFLLPLGLAWGAFEQAEKLREASQLLEEKNAALADSLDRVASERRDERLMLAGELHDSVLPLLFRVHLMSRVLKQDLDSGQLLQLDKDLPELIDATDAAQVAVREVVSDLRRSVLGPAGLAGSIRQVAEGLESSSKVRISLLLEDVEGSSLSQLVLYQIAREALTNAATHARAENVECSLQELSGELVLRIVDDGIGFDVRLGSPQGHFGLQLMRERAEAVGGRILIESVRGEGTTVTMILPQLPPDHA